MFAICPKRCTGMIARVRLEMQASMPTGSMLKVFRSISAKTGLAPRRAMVPAVAKKL